MKKVLAYILATVLSLTGASLYFWVQVARAGVSCSLPFTLTNGTIADASQVMANYNALVTCLTNAAAAGANNDITSLSGLTTAITPGQGGSNVFIGPTPTVSGNQWIFSSATVPTGWSNTKGYSLVFVAPATNPTVLQFVVNGQATANVFKLSSGGPIALTGSEVVTNQAYAAIFDGTQFEINPFPNVTAGWGIAVAPTGVSINTVNPPYGFGPCVNMTLNATVGSNLLGVQVFAADSGAQPTASHPVLCSFRDPTIANGDPTWKSITSPVYMDTNAAGASLGTSNGLPFRIWVVLYYNGGTPTLGLWQSTSFTPLASAQSNVNLSTIDEAALQSPTAISNASTSAGTFYAPNGSSITNSPFRILGYMDWANGLSTAGSYASGPTKIQLFGPGIKKPGDRINLFRQATTATGTNANNYTQSSIPPVPANGATVVTLTVTPTALMDIFNFKSVSFISCGSCGYGTAFVYDGTRTLAAGTEFVPATAAGVPADFATIITSTSKVLTLYYTSNSGTSCLNASNGGTCTASAFGTSFLQVEEIQP